MKITADTNLLVRALIDDDPAQGAIAREELRSAELIVITLPALCELVWVLRRFYGLARADIATELRALIKSENVAVTDAPSVTAGFAMLDAGGDFADGAIAHNGRWLGGETFVSFDEKAVKLLTAAGERARLPG